MGEYLTNNVRFVGFLENFIEQFVFLAIDYPRVVRFFANCDLFYLLFYFR